MGSITACSGEQHSVPAASFAQLILLLPTQAQCLSEGAIRSSSIYIPCSACS